MCNPENSSSSPDVIIRPADLRDVSGIYRLIKDNPDELIVRPMGNIIQNIDRFIVAEIVGGDEKDSGRLVACASWLILPEVGDVTRTTIELASVVVAPDRRRNGLGRQIVQAAIKRVSSLRPMQIIVLTFTPPFFASLGFSKIDKHAIMHKIYMGCMNCTKHSNPFTCPEVAMAYVPDANS